MRLLEVYDPGNPDSKETLFHDLGPEQAQLFDSHLLVCIQRLSVSAVHTILMVADLVANHWTTKMNSYP